MSTVPRSLRAGLGVVELDVGAVAGSGRRVVRSWGTRRVLRPLGEGLTMKDFGGGGGHWRVAKPWAPEFVMIVPRWPFIDGICRTSPALQRVDADWAWAALRRLSRPRPPARWRAWRVVAKLEHTSWASAPGQAGAGTRHRMPGEVPPAAVHEAGQARTLVLAWIKI